MVCLCYVFHALLLLVEHVMLFIFFTFTLVFVDHGNKTPAPDKRNIKPSLKSKKQQPRPTIRQLQRKDTDHLSVAPVTTPAQQEDTLCGPCSFIKLLADLLLESVRNFVNVAGEEEFMEISYECTLNPPERSRISCIDTV